MVGGESLPPDGSLPTDMQSLTWGTPSLPSWVKELRPHQIDAITECVQAYENGAQVVWLDAPTGSGKTLIAECVRRILQARATYICSSLSLQDQFKRDFGYARVLKGRSNYPTLDRPFPEYTAADCTRQGDEGCLWCHDTAQCGYEVAKREAKQSQLVVTNTAYFLHEANYIGKLNKDRELTIVDECDVLEKELMGFIQFGVSDSMLKRLKISAPRKGVHRPTIAAWFDEELKPAIIKHRKSLTDKESIRSLRERQTLTRLLAATLRVSREVENENWVRDNDAGPLVLKPIRVDEYGTQYLWTHSPRWLCMSATIISPDELSDSLGLTLPWEVVRVPMTFPVENRRINVVPVANMVAKEKDTSYPRMATAISNVLQMHPGERTLVHTVSYDLANYLHSSLSSNGRRYLRYQNAQERETILQSFRNTPGAVLFAPSMDRGIDLKGEDCRVCIVAKVPYPYLGDRQVSERANGKGGRTWYSVQTIRSLVQMTGRGVRSDDDWCVTYILDQQFTKNVLSNNSNLLPKWWAEAIDRTIGVRELLLTT